MKRISIALLCAVTVVACGGGSTPDVPDSGVLLCTTNAECGALEDACNDGVCGADGACTAVPANGGNMCDDSDACTVSDICAAGVCAGTAVDCTGLDTACTAGTCNSATGACEAMATNEGNACDDGDFCTDTDVCTGGTCAGGAVDCSGLDDDCNTGMCDPADGSCIAVTINEGNACDDGDLCTTGEICATGTCAGPAVDCSALDDGCNAGSCDPATGGCFATPTNEGLACDDADACTTGEVCTTGACGGGGMLDCTVLTGACTLGTCDPASGCVAMPVSDGAPCDDGNLCSTSETCGNGTCGGLPAGSVYFSEDFSDNGAGWTLGTEWQIGPAMASTGGTGGSLPDPATDHTATADDGVAGVVIGGNASTAMLHGFYYLESPVIDLSGAVTAHFSFWRWLNSDYPNYMNSTIDVYDGTAWVNLFSMVNPITIYDSAWTFQQYDVSAYANANFRIRFGFDIGQTGVFTVGSWNVDDVTITPAPCASYGCTNAVPVDCSALSDQCNTGMCDGATGGCVAAPIPDGTVCTADADPCTSDACATGVCVGTAVDCSAFADQCNAGLCDATGACGAVPFADGTPCDDGDPFTCADSCVAGGCGGGVCPCGNGTLDAGEDCDDGNTANADGCSTECNVEFYFERFDAGGPPVGWTFASNSATVNWQVDGMRSTSAPSSLYYGNPAVHNYVGAGTVIGSAFSPTFVVPATGAVLSFRRFLATENFPASYDQLDVNLVDAANMLLVTLGNNLPDTGGAFVYYTVAIPATYAGMTVKIQLNFNSVDSIANNFEGAYVDDFSVSLL